MRQQLAEFFLNHSKGILPLGLRIKIAWALGEKHTIWMINFYGGQALIDNMDWQGNVQWLRAAMQAKDPDAAHHLMETSVQCLLNEKKLPKGFVK
mgnify:CR=1 FL=1